MKTLKLNSSSLSIEAVKELKKKASSEQEHRRYFAIELLLKKEERSTIVRILDLGVNTLNQWITKVNQKGLESLKTQAGRGSKPLKSLNFLHVFL